jgi:hypothetical protein
MSAKAKRRRNAARAEARFQADGAAVEKRDEARRRRWDREWAEEVRIRKAVEDGTATQEERDAFEKRQAELDRFRRNQDGGLSFGMGYGDDLDLELERSWADWELFLSKLKDLIMECMPLHRVDVTTGWRNFSYIIHVYFEREDELLASAAGAMGEEMERMVTGWLQENSPSYRDKGVIFRYGSRENVVAAYGGDFVKHQRRYEISLRKAERETRRAARLRLRSM